MPLKVQESRPATDDEIYDIVRDPLYMPNKAEFLKFEQVKADKPWYGHNFGATVKSALGVMLGDLVRMTKGIAQERLKHPLGQDPRTDPVMQSLGEAMTRGTYDLEIIRKKVLGRLLPDWLQAGGNDDDSRYAKFRVLRNLERMREQARQGDINLLFELGHVRNDIAEGASVILDPMMIAPGFGVSAKAGQKVLGAGMRGTGRAISAPARLVSRAGDALTEGIASAIDRVAPGVSHTAVRRGAVGAAAAGGLAVGSPALAAPAGVYAASRPLAAFGDVLSEGGRVVSRGPSLRGVFEEVAASPRVGPMSQRMARALTHLEPTLRAGAVTAHRAAEGAAIGGALGVLSGEPEGLASGIGGGLAIGGFFGLPMHVIQAGSPGRRMQAEVNDINRFRQKMVDNGRPTTGFDALDHDTKVQATVVDGVFGGNIDIQILNNADYIAASAREGKPGRGAGMFVERPEGQPDLLLVNRDDIGSTPRKTFLHETAHAIWRSDAVDKSAIESELIRMFGDAGMTDLMRDYARSDIVDERRSALAQAKRGMITDADIAKIRGEITSADVDTRVQALSERGTLAEEVWADAFADSTLNENLDRLRKGRSITEDVLEPLRMALGEAKAKLLRRLGVDVQPDGTIQNKDSLFKSVPMQGDRRFKRLVQNYLHDIDTMHGSIRRRRVEQTAGATIGMDGLGQHPAAGWRPLEGKPGWWQNDFATKGPDGKVRPKDGSEIEATIRLRQGETMGMIPAEILPQSDTRLGRRSDGKIRGKVLPQEIYGLTSISDDIKSILRWAESEMDSGGTGHAWYQAIGSSTGKEYSWRRNVMKNLGNFRARKKHFKPVEFQLTNEGNLLITSLDVGLVFEKASRWRKQGKLNDLWGGDLVQFETDMMRYLRNHAEGRPGADGIGEAKRNTLRAFFAVPGGSNPLASLNVSRADKAGLIRGFRVDRMATFTPSNRRDIFFDYGKVKQNLLPGKGDQPDPPRVIVSTNPGNDRGYGLPVGATFSDLMQLHDRMINSIVDRDGQIRILRRMQMPHQFAHILGTFERMEPSIEIRFPGQTLDDANRVAPLLGDALLQDAVITAQPVYEGQTFGVALSKRDGTPFSAQEIEQLYRLANPTKDKWGLNFSTSEDNTYAKFLDGSFFEKGDAYGPGDFDKFLAVIAPISENMNLEIGQFNQKGDYHDHAGFQKGLGKIWSEGTSAGSPDLQRAAEHDLYQPVWTAYTTFFGEHRWQLPDTPRPSPFTGKGGPALSPGLGAVETIGTTTVISFEGGVRILTTPRQRGMTWRVYGPNDQLLGIFSSEEKARRRAVRAARP